jgi:hypothetical protein
MIKGVVRNQMKYSFFTPKFLTTSIILRNYTKIIILTLGGV